MGRVESLAPAGEDSSASAGISWEGATAVSGISLVYTHLLEQQAAELVLSPLFRLLLFPFPPPQPALTHPYPVLPIGSEHRQRVAEPRAATRPGGAGSRAARDSAGMVEGLMASASLLGNRSSALPELVMLLCSSGERCQKGWVTNLEVLRGIK